MKKKNKGLCILICRPICSHISMANAKNMFNKGRLDVFCPKNGNKWIQSVSLGYLIITEVSVIRSDVTINRPGVISRKPKRAFTLVATDHVSQLNEYVISVFMCK